MPQLNFYTFFNNHFYFSLAFCIAYLVLLGYILPKIALILKFRAKYPLFISKSLFGSDSSANELKCFPWTPKFGNPDFSLIFFQTNSSLQTVLKYNRSFQYSTIKSIESFLSKK